jgi:hypothetical protein
VAHFSRATRFERAILALPDVSRPELGLEVDTIDLFEDMLDFVRNELRRVARQLKKNFDRDRVIAAVPSERGAGVERWPTLQLFEPNDHNHARRSGESLALAPEGRRPA